MPWYSTSYPVGRSVYGCELWAKDEREARMLAKRRGLGERVTGRGDPIIRPSEQFKSGDMLNGLHGLAFLSYLAIRSCVADAAEILSDNGILHDMLHWYAFNQRERIVCRLDLPVLLARVRVLEDRVPGYTAKEEGP